MADRGRDLKVAILSDADRFDLAKPADQLDDLATAAGHADRALDLLDPARTARKINDLGIEAKDTARKVDDAFDAIARSSKTAAGKVGADTSTIKRKLGDVADEAKDTARETAASLANFGGDLASAGQEIAANAGALFGPVGLAIGAALSAGIAMFQQNAEDLKQTTEDILGYMIDAGGRLTAAAIEKRINAVGMEALELQKIATEARVPVSDFLRAVAGDPKAIKAVSDALVVSREEYAATLTGSANAAEMLDAYDAAARRVAMTMGRTAEATKLASDAIAAMNGATSSAAAAAKSEEDALAAVTRAYRTAERVMKDPIVVKLDVDLGAFNAKILGAQRKLDALTRYMP